MQIKLNGVYLHDTHRDKQHHYKRRILSHIHYDNAA